MTDGCAGCGCPFPRTEEYYSKDAKSPDGLNRCCRICENDRVSKWYYNNQTDILERRYQKYHDPDTIKQTRAYFAQKARERRAKQRANPIAQPA